MSAQDRDANLEAFLAMYRQTCADAGVEPLAEDVARESAKAMMGVLMPAFEDEFRRH
jgi:hypothetical protein